MLDMSIELEDTINLNMKFDITIKIKTAGVSVVAM